MDDLAVREQETTPTVSVWEDIVDIFYTPSTVFARRGDGRIGLLLVILTILFTILATISFSVLAPVYEADMMRQMATVLEANPELSEADLEGMRSFGKISMIIGSILFAPMVALVVGGLTRLAGALFDATLTFRLSAMIALYAQFPRVLQQLVNLIQGTLLPAESMNSRFSLGIGPARFLDVETTAPFLLTIAERFDIFTIWATLILAVGIRVLGKVPGGRAYLAAGLVWLLASLPTLLGVSGS